MKYLLIGTFFISSSLFAQATPPIQKPTATASTLKWDNIKSNASQMNNSPKALAKEKAQAKAQKAKENAEKYLIKKRVKAVEEGSANAKTLGLGVKKAAAR